jgi:hypothetical protein
MRTLSEQEIDRVGGGLDSITIGGFTVDSIEAGLALRNVLGSAGVAFGVGYGIGTLVYNGYTAVSGDSLGTDIYQASEQCW